MPLDHTSEKDATEARRSKLYSLLGDLPPLDRKVSGQSRVIEDNDNYRLEYLLLDLNGMEATPGYLAIPKRAPKPCPVVLYNHAHGGDYELGKEELRRSRPELIERAYLTDLINLGFAVLCIDHWLFGERHGRAELEFFKESIWRGRVIWGMMVYDSLKALDYIETRNELDAGRIGSLGLSMGSTMTWWLAALDERIKVGVDLCCLTDFEAFEQQSGLTGHSIYYFVPGLLKHFNTIDICAMAVPRARLALAGARDPLTPISGLEEIDKAMKVLYASHGAENCWKLIVEDVAHQETLTMRREALDFLQQHL